MIGKRHPTATRQETAFKCIHFFFLLGIPNMSQSVAPLETTDDCGSFPRHNRFQCRLPHPVRLLLCVEGGNDVQFLRRVSRIYNAADPVLPDLANEELEQRLMFIPRGGSTQQLWIGRLAPMGLPEFHLFDRDLPPATALHRRAAEAINAMPQCRARVTHKRELESYLHPDAIREAGGLTVTFTDDDDVAEIVARESYARSRPASDWSDVPRRHRKRLKNRVKSWLNRGVVDRMTHSRLIERDPLGDVPAWLAEIATMLTWEPAIGTCSFRADSPGSKWPSPRA